MHQYYFTLELDIKGPLNDEIANSIFEAGCDDATLSSYSDGTFLLFTRESTDLQSAISSAKADVSKTGIAVLGVETLPGEEK